MYTQHSIDDEIIETGTSGVWTYRKWKSGIAECFGNLYQGTNSLETGGVKDLTSIDFPFEFQAIPVLLLSNPPYNLLYYGYTHKDKVSLGIRCFFNEKNSFIIRGYCIGKIS